MEPSKQLSKKRNQPFFESLAPIEAIVSGAHYKDFDNLISMPQQENNH